MNQKILMFRNVCAEEGIELTPEEANAVFNVYQSLRQEIAEAVAQYPNFYLNLCNRTTEDKLEDIRLMNEANGANITLKEYNQLQETIKIICEIDGHV